LQACHLQAISEPVNQLLDAYAGIAQNPAEGAESNFIVQWNCNGELFRIRWMTEANVTALLPHHRVSKLG